VRETDRSVSVSEGDRLRDRRRYVRVRERVRQIYLYFYIQRRKILSLPFLWDALLQKNLTVAVFTTAMVIMSRLIVVA